MKQFLLFVLALACVVIFMITAQAFMSLELVMYNDPANPTCRAWSGHCDEELFMVGGILILTIIAAIAGFVAACEQLAREQSGEAGWCCRRDFLQHANR